MREANITQKNWFVPYPEVNIVGKEENVGKGEKSWILVFSRFSAMFLKALFLSDSITVDFLDDQGRDNSFYQVTVFSMMVHVG